MSAILFAQPHTISGQITYPKDSPSARPTDMTDQKVNVYVTIWFFKIHAGTFTTDAEGRFTLDYKVRHLPFRKTHTLVMEIIGKKAPYKGMFSCLVSKERTLDSHKVSVANNSREVGNVNIQGKILEYLPDRPGLKQPEDSKNRFHRLSADYLFELAKASAPEKLKTIAGGFLRKLGIGKGNTAILERRFGEADPNLKISPETTLDMITNGIYPCNWLKGRSENEFVTKIDWFRYDQDVEPQLPNVTLVATKEGNKLNVSAVQIQFRPDREPQLYEPDDKEFEYALGIFNCSALCRGEVESHLGRGHVVTEQHSMAVFRHIRPGTPLGRLLHPHLRDVFEINRLGKSAIFGPEGVLNVTGLTPKGVAQALDDVLAGTDYTYYQPREAVCESDRLSPAKKLYWEVLGKVVDGWFKENEQGIKAQWHQVKNMSTDLVRHSRPYHRWNSVDKHSDWIDGSEIDNPNLPGRQVFDGELRVIRPITQDDEGDWNRLKQFCQFAIFTATFWHSAVHISQAKWGTNLDVAVLAPRNDGKGKHFGTSVKDAERQLSVAHTFTSFVADTLLEDADGDVLRVLQAAIRSKEAEFKALGFPVSEILRSVII